MRRVMLGSLKVLVFPRRRSQNTRSDFGLRFILVNLTGS